MQQRRQPMDRKMMREINQNILLNLIRIHAPVSRSQLKELSGLSLGTIVGITAKLIEQALVVETGYTESTGGRRAELLELAPDGSFVLGADLREYEITGVILNLHGEVVQQQTWPAHLRGNAANAVDIVASGIESFIEQSKLERKKILGLGCGVSGPVDTYTGSCVDSWILDWHDVALTEPLGERLDMPVFVDNAVNCLASYEKLYGDGQQFHDFLLVTVGRGLGMAIVVRDDLYRGTQGMGAEFGHIPFEMEGRRCECGKYGCLEAYVASHGLMASYQEQLATAPQEEREAGASDVASLFAQAEAGNIPALRTLEQTATYLGVGLATLINLFNPGCIILNCDDGFTPDLMLNTLVETMQKHIFSQLGDNLVFLAKDHTQVDWARGAGCLVLRDFFSSPVRL